MREILFRGKRVDGIGNRLEWVEGSLVCWPDDDGIYTIVNFDNVDEDGRVFGDHIEVSRDTVGQFTGMRDATGKKIFEGDFIQLYADVKKTFNADDGDVRYSRGGFFVGSYGNTLKSLNALADYTGMMRGVVIGNIHDNPELMKKDEG